MTANHDSWSLKRQQRKDSEGYDLFRKNLAPAIGVRNPGYSYIAYLTFLYVPTDQPGLASPDDEEALFVIESERFRELELDDLAVHVAAVTQRGMKDFLFYTRDPQHFLARAERFRVEYPQFQIGCEIAPDPLWKHYDEFP